LGTVVEPAAAASVESSSSGSAANNETDFSQSFLAAVVIGGDVICGDIVRDSESLR
jgi:hypothetical protein